MNPSTNIIMTPPTHFPPIQIVMSFIHQYKKEPTHPFIKSFKHQHRNQIIHSIPWIHSLPNLPIILALGPSHPYTPPSTYAFIPTPSLCRFLPEVQLVLVGLWNSGERVEVRQELNAVVRLDVVHPVAEHLQQRVKNPPSVGLKYIWQELTWIGAENKKRERALRRGGRACWVWRFHYRGN